MHHGIEVSPPASVLNFCGDGAAQIDMMCQVHFLRYEFLPSELWSSNRQTESDAYEAAVHKHRRAQRLKKGIVNVKN